MSNPLFAHLYSSLICVLCQHLPTSPVLLSPCGHIYCQPCLSAFLGTSAKQHLCPECWPRETPIGTARPLELITALIGALTPLQPLDLQEETKKGPVLKPALQAEEPVKTLDIEVDPDGLDPCMTLLSHRYFRLPETATASIVLKAVQTLLNGASAPTRLFLTTSKAQKVVLKRKMTLRDAKWLFEQGEGKKMVLYYTSKA